MKSKLEEFRQSEVEGLCNDNIKLIKKLVTSSVSLNVWLL